MAQRRMFSKTVIFSDPFIELPFSSQALYFHLSMDADDDGFVNSPKRIQRMINATDEDLRLLEESGFVFRFRTGITVITHWKLNNSIQKDRYKPTVFTREKELLSLEDGVYTERIQDGYDTYSQYSTVQYSTVQNRREKEEEGLEEGGETIPPELTAPSEPSRFPFLEGDNSPTERLKKQMRKGNL